MINIDNEIGKLAYEEDVRRYPLYPDGTSRHSWDQLSVTIQETWINHPIPRNYIEHIEATLAYFEKINEAFPK